ncbi:hypothetical protein [Tessaracoccus coleopterorum]|nr:hypothetical protein [Tessaracoccus coleopterorum]
MTLMPSGPSPSTVSTLWSRTWAGMVLTGGMDDDENVTMLLNT